MSAAVRLRLQHTHTHTRTQAGEGLECGGDVCAGLRAAAEGRSAKARPFATCQADPISAHGLLVAHFIVRMVS